MKKRNRERIKNDLPGRSMTELEPNQVDSNWTPDLVFSSESKSLRQVVSSMD